MYRVIVIPRYFKDFSEPKPYVAEVSHDYLRAYAFLNGVAAGIVAMHGYIIDEEYVENLESYRPTSTPEHRRFAYSDEYGTYITEVYIEEIP